MFVVVAGIMPLGVRKKMVRAIENLSGARPAYKYVQHTSILIGVSAV